MALLAQRSSVHNPLSQSSYFNALFLAILVCLAFGNSLWGSFHFDDSHSIVENISVHSIKNIPAFWTDPTTSSFIVENRTYRPLTYTFFALLWEIGRGSTVPFHVFKLFLHFLMTLALFNIWKTLWAQPRWNPIELERIRVPFTRLYLPITPETMALSLAGLFAVHPACSEVVNYIVATSSLQCAVFYAWGFLFYLKGRQGDGVKYLALSLFFFFCSVASKEEGMTFPAMIWVTEVMLMSEGLVPSLTKATKVALPYVLFAMILGIILFLMRPSSGELSRSLADRMIYFMTQWRAYLWYMRLWIWPWDLNADNMAFGFSFSIFDSKVIQAILGNTLVLISVWLLRVRFPALLFGFLWFYITISPASSIVVLGEPVNEHRMYLAYIGLAGALWILSLSVFESLWSSIHTERSFPILYFLLLIGLILGSQERNRVWADDKSLWTDNVEKNPDSGRALNNLALVYEDLGEMPKAIELLDKCEKIDKEYYCPLNRGTAYLKLAESDQARNFMKKMKEDLQQAEISLVKSQKLNPGNVHANFHLGRLYQEFRNDCSTAIVYYEKAIALNGNRFPIGQVKLAACYRALGQSSKADETLNKAAELDPESEFVLAALGDLELTKNNLDLAFHYYQRLTILYPQRPSGFSGLTLVALKKKDHALAVEMAKKWHEISPLSLVPVTYWGVASKRRGDSEGVLSAENAYYSIGLSSPSSGEFLKRLEEMEKLF